MFTVTIARTITTTVAVSEATSMADAVRLVKAYGPLEAAHDFVVISEDMTDRVVRAGRLTADMLV